MRNTIVALVCLAWLASSAAQAQTTNYSLGTTALLVGPATGSNSVVLAVTPQTAAWTATTNVAWLHLSPSDQGGAGSTNVVFSYDANSGATRSGTLTIGDQTLNVTQAGSTYVIAQPLTTLASSHLSTPCGVAVDAAGNAYIADYNVNVIDKWTAANNTLTTLVSSGLSYPNGVAVDGTGNVYIADTDNRAIKMWTEANSNLTTLISSGLSEPTGVAVDGAGNVYITDTNVIKMWSAANSNLITLVSSGLGSPSGGASAWGLAVDGAGNVYIADTGTGSIKVWTAANNTLTTLVSSGLHGPPGVAVDGAGNVYIADAQNQAIKKWTAANKTVTTLVSSGLSYPNGVAVDGAGNVYIVNEAFPPTVKELPYAFVDPTTKLETAAAGSDVLPAVLPATANLAGPFTPTSNQPWLAITGITNGVVSFAFAPTSTNRTAHISLLGKTISVTQTATVTPPVLTGGTIPANGAFQFSFTNSQGASFTVLTTTNPALPMSSWTVAGTPTNNGAGLFQFSTDMATNDPQLYYRVRSP